MSKKVLFIITKSNWGGAQRYVYDLATHMPEDQFAVAVATGGHGALVEKLQENNIHIVTIPHLERDINILNEIKATFALWNIIDTERPDIVHLNSSKIGGLGAFVVYCFRWWINLREKKNYWPSIIFTVHGWAFNEDRAPYARYLIRLIQWITTLMCDWVIIISNRDYLQAIHLPLVKRKKFILIPLGIPEESIVFLPKALARAELAQYTQTKITKRTTLIGTVAELTKNKGLEYFIGALATMDTETNTQQRVVILGIGEDKEKLQNLIRAHALQDMIILGGFLPNAATYLKAFDLFILPSLKEGLPYTLIEAMHAGVPIVATHVGGIPDLIENNTNGIVVPPKNSEALARGIKQLIADKKLRGQFAKESAKKVSTKFSFEAMIRHTIALYQQQL